MVASPTAVGRVSPPEGSRMPRAEEKSLLDFSLHYIYIYIYNVVLKKF